MSAHRKARVRAGMFERQGGLCWYCAGTMRLGGPINAGTTASLDHVHPRVLAPAPNLGQANLVCACVTCNRRKGGLTLGEFRRAMAPLAGLFFGEMIN